MKKTLSMLAIMSAILVSCEKSENVEVWEDNPDPEYSISISPSELIFGATGGEQTVRVTSYYQDASYSTIGWELYGESEWKKSDDGLWYCEAAEWCKVSMIEGGDGDKLSFIITSFNFGDTEKKCSFTLSCGEAEMEFTVTQGIDDSPIIQFSDPAFEKVVIIQADFNVDNKISEAEAAYLKELDLSEKELTDLSDIKYFINLTYLDCSYNQLTTLDLSKNIELIELNSRILN